MDRQTLKDAAERAESAGNLEEAVGLYEQLEALDATDPTWACRLAEIHRTNKDRPARIRALCRAALAFDASGLPLKGVATAKLALSLDPKNAGTLEVLGKLQRRETTDLTPIEETADLEISVLPPIPLFSALSESAFSRLLDRSRLFDAEAGEVVFEKGDASTSLYVIAEGSVDVVLEEGAPPVSRLGAGEFFGEMGVFTKRPRGATIVVADRAQLLEMPKEVLDDLVRDERQILSVLLTFFGQRLIQNVLRRAALFRDLGETERERLRERFVLTDLKAGAVLIEQGRKSPGLWVLIDGTVEVRRSNGSASTVIAKLEPGAMFGEVSVMTRLPAVATVVAPAKCLVLLLPADRFHEVAAEHPALLAHATMLASERMDALANRVREEPLLLT